jgi:hypothetical protein
MKDKAVPVSKQLSFKPKRRLGNAFFNLLLIGGKWASSRPYPMIPITQCRRGYMGSTVDVKAKISILCSVGNKIRLPLSSIHIPLTMKINPRKHSYIPRSGAVKSSVSLLTGSKI